MITDTHAHYDDERYDEDRAELMASLASCGVGAVINVGSTWESLEKVKELGETYPMVFTAYGIHPDEVGSLERPAEETEEKVDFLRSCLRLPKAVAVGEIGLDYHWMTETKEVQDRWFRAQLDLAREAKLPVIIHSRDAAEDTLRVCKEEDAGAIGGVMHCFSYEKEMAREFLNLGLHLGIGGVVTFKNGRKLKEVVGYAPLENLLLETDCPYLAPEPHRGKRNVSHYLPLVVKAVAEIKKISEEEVIEVTTANAKRLFAI